jgi:hypothetical protein
VPLTWDISLDLLAELYVRDYPRHLDGRRDIMQYYLATLSRPLNDYLDVGLQYAYVNNDSSVGLFAYGRNIFSLVGEVGF